jgi:HAE1 family hydrophobic/amphiphilic exporter-1
VIRYTLRNKLNVLLFVLLPTILITVYLVPKIGSELIPEVHQGEFNVEISYPIGTPVEQTAKNLLEIESFILGLDEVATVSTRSGVDKSATTKSEEGEHTAKITVRLKVFDDVKHFENIAIGKIRKYLADKSGIESKFSRNEMFSFKTPIEIFIKGYNLEKLTEFNEIVLQKVAEVEGIADVKSNIKRGNPEIHIVYDREKMSRYDLNILNVANSLRNKILGDVSTKYRDLDRRIDITVLLQEKYKHSVSDIGRIVINPGQEKPIVLSAVADIYIGEGPSEIRRVDQERTAVITANITGEKDLKSVISEIDAMLAEIDFGNEFFVELAGQNKEMETSMNSLLMALLLAVFLVYIIMASQFESFIHPLVILFSIPLAIVGVIFVLFLMEIPLSIMVYLGLIMLAGIVVNNAIVLVSHINHLRETGMDKVSAIIEGGKVRLRPILMTTMTTVLGLLPMALGLGDGAEIRQPMAITVIAGLISSTFLTLIIIPTVYAVFDFEKEVLE